MYDCLSFFFFTVSCETLFNKMRSTYVAKSPRLKLCSDAFTITSLESSDRDIAIQSKKNLQENIPNISLLLSKELHDNKGNLSPEALVTIIHKYVLNEFCLINN